MTVSNPFQSVRFNALKKKITLSLCCSALLTTPNFADTLLEEEKLYRLEPTNITAIIMSSKLDELNRNIYQIDGSTLRQKGFINTENIFRYLSFVSISNTGLGGNLDLRGQGNKANTSVQTLINGVYANMLDSSHGVTPINSIPVSLIQEIEILPGGGAVMFGNGTRGGVVNIITAKRFQKPYFSIEAGYSNIAASTGNNYNVNVLYGDKFGDTHINVGASYLYKSGPRQNDRATGEGANFNLLYDFDLGQSLNFDADFFHANMHTSPFNSFLDSNGQNPSKNQRKRSGNGEFHNIQNRFTTNLGYESELSKNIKWKINAFYHYNHLKYKDSITRLSTYAYQTFSFKDAQANQSGSLFDDQKIGIDAKFDFKHQNGRFIVGALSLYQMSKRTMIQSITTPNPTQMSMGGQTLQVKYNHLINIPFTGDKWTNSIFAIEKYDFNEYFSLTGGGRYEFSRYFIDVKNAHNILIDMGVRQQPINYTTLGKLTDNLHNFALELTPSLKYSDTGTVYAKYERGYLSPAPNNMLKREGTSSANYAYKATNLKKESYDTFEIGSKESFADFLWLSGSIFYTLTHNEFYTIGNAHSVDGVQYDSYDKTRRLGVELASEQYFLGGALAFNESFTYVKAEKKELDKWSKIPNSYNYKGTLGASLDIGYGFGIWTQSAFIGSQQVLSKNSAGVEEDKSLKAYSLVDLGVSYSYRKVSISTGVRNIADTMYYDYYNHDQTDTIAGYGYLVGTGRTFFIEGKYEF